jgi:hypothetical protein
MSGSPWTGPSPHGSSGDGGMEHLETDVMRFMAILAFCLVAVFALVQSVPQPAEPDPGAQEQDAETAPAAPLPAAVVVPATAPPEPRAPAPASAIEPAPAPADPRPAPVATQERAAAAEPAPAAPENLPEPPEPAEPTAQAPTERAFSLRFESDAALIGLVERQEVVLYAFSAERVWRFMIVDGRPTFRTAASPGQVHEMTASTVPGEVVSALRRSVVVPPGPLRWGVTLPPPTAAVLDRVVGNGGGGELVIDAEGFLRLEGDS